PARTRCSPISAPASIRRELASGRDLLDGRRLLRGAPDLPQRVLSHSGLPLLAWMARITRSAVMGCSVIIAPCGASASLTALSTAPGAPAVPPSPAPLNPPATCGAGVSR